MDTQEALDGYSFDDYASSYMNVGRSVIFVKIGSYR